jgi:uncharacterized protein (TIGR03545 family)
MRKSYLLPRFMALFLAWAFFFFAFDPLVKWGLIKGLEKGAKAKVEIGSLHTAFLHPSLKLTSFALADSKNEYSNLVEFSELSFSAEGAPLLEKKLVVDDASLKGLRFGTPRKTSGKLPFVKEEPSPLVESMKKETAGFALDRAADAKASAAKDYTVDPSQLESVKLARQLEDDYNKNYKDIAARFDAKKYQDQLNELKTRYEKAKSGGNPLNQAKEYAAIARDAKKVLDGFSKDKADTQAALAKAKDSFKTLDDARKRDVAAAMAKMKLPSLDPQSLARMLAGPAIAEKTATGLKWLAIARKYIPSSSKGAASSAARRGRVVQFPKENAYPAVLIKRLSLTGELGSVDPLEYSGTIEGLTTQPRVYGKPAVAVVKGEKGARKLDFRATLDATGAQVQTDSSLLYAGIPVNKMRLGSPSSLLVDISGGTGSFEGSLKTSGEDLDGKASLRLAGASFKAAAGSVKPEALRRAVESSFSGLSSASIGAGISGTMKSPVLSVSTDLADALSRAFGGAMGAELKQAQEEAQRKVDEALKPYRSKLDGLAASKQAELEGRLKDAETKISASSGGLLKNLAPGKLKLPKLF